MEQRKKEMKQMFLKGLSQNTAPGEKEKKVFKKRKKGKNIVKYRGYRSRASNK